MRKLRKLFVILAVLLVAGEIAARVWDGFHGGTGSLYDFIVAGAPGRRFKLRSGVAVTVPERYGDIRYSFNREGYRDDDPAPGPGRRIVLLGDSVSFGLGVDQDGIYAALLERRLREELRQPWEVINLAIFAYNTADELQALEEDGLKRRPELVLLQFYMNDFSIPAGAGGPPPPPPSLGQRLTALKNRLLFQSAFYRRLHQAGTGLTFHLFHDLRRSRFPETLNAAEPRDKLAYLKATPDDRIAAFRKIREIHRLARENGARLLIVLSPDEVQLFDRRYDGINARFRDFCRREGIDLFDPLPALRAAPDPVRLFNDGVHYSPEGHALLARLLFDELRRHGLPG
ncbi:MAG TPA: SGNH/GDSL hydrolase family protein [Thermoanaerobaculia bacterium]